MPLRRAAGRALEMLGHPDPHDDSAADREVCIPAGRTRRLRDRYGDRSACSSLSVTSDAVGALARTAGDDMATAIIETGSKDRMSADPVVQGSRQGTAGAEAGRDRHHHYRATRPRVHPGGRRPSRRPAGRGRPELPDPPTCSTAPGDVLVPVHEGRRRPTPRTRRRDHPAVRGLRVRLRPDLRSHGPPRQGRTKADKVVIRVA